MMPLRKNLTAEDACAQGDNARKQQCSSDFVSFKEIHNGSISFVLKFAMMTFI
jgi:hypothetical protein